MALDLDFSRFKVPAGSLLVDGALVFALVYYGGQMTERLEQVSRRMDVVEQAYIRGNADARILVLERRADEMSEFKAEMRDQLNRIEDKLDRLVQLKQ